LEKRIIPQVAVNDSQNPASKNRYGFNSRIITPANKRNLKESGNLPNSWARIMLAPIIAALIAGAYKPINNMYRNIITRVAIPDFFLEIPKNIRKLIKRFMMIVICVPEIEMIWRNPLSFKLSFKSLGKP